MTRSSSNDAPEFAPLVVESDDSVGRPGGGSGRPGGRVVVAVAAAVIAAGVVLGLAVADSSTEEAIESPPSTAPVTEPIASLAPVATALPFGAQVTDVGDRVPTMSQYENIAGWVEWSLPTIDGFSPSLAATEVVTITADGVLHRIELPDGRVRSRVVPDVSTDAQIALTAEAVAVPQFDDVAIVADDGSLVTLGETTGEVPRVVALGASDRFLVAGGRMAADGAALRWLVDADGAVTRIAPGAFADADPWDLQFLPTGELLVNGGGVVDAVGADDTVRRIEDGDVVATGRNHYAIRQCDPTCRYTVVDISTGDRVPAEFAALDDYRFYDTSGRLSPDGRHLHLADWRRERPRALLISAATGNVVNSWPLDTIRAPDAWSADSSGYFGTVDGALAFRSVDGEVTVIDGLGALRSVATRPLG